MRWALLDENEDGYDVFGDGTVRCWRTPGHSPGHQSFEVKLAEQRRRSCSRSTPHTRPTTGRSGRYPASSPPRWTPSARCRKLHHLARRSDATVVTGHDPDAWPTFRHSPEAYD